MQFLECKQPPWPLNGVLGWLVLMLLLAIASQFGVAQASDVLTLYVSPLGNDQSSGRSEQGPLRTWAAAQAHVRQELARMIQGQLPRQSIQVVFLPGNYMLDREIRFSAQDSGVTDAPVTYMAREPGTVRISGGRRLEFSGHRGDGIILTGLPLGWNPLDPGQLFVTGQRTILARQPNAGHEWFVARPIWQSGENTANAGKAAFVPDMQAQHWLEGLSVQERRRAIVNMYQSWTNGFHHLADDSTPEHWHIVPSASFAFLNFGDSQRFHVENIPAALDDPGEWIGEADRIIYLPRPQETESAIGRDAVLAALDRLVIFDERGEQAHDIRFDGLVFEHVRQSIPTTGLLDSQAAVDIGAAIEVNNAVRIAFDRCTVRHVGGFGLWLKTNVRDSLVSRSTFDDLGGGGIKVGDKNQHSDAPPRTGSNEISNNVVRHTGQIVSGAVGIWIGPSWDNVVRNNLIAQTTYSAISVGWKWGYGDSTSGRNQIINNLIFNIGQGMMADLGGIYTLGPSPGTVIAGNVIREIHGYRAYGSGAWGIYNDEGSSHIVVKNNIVINTDSGGYHLNYGQNNMVHSNIFAGSQRAEIRISLGDPNGISATFEDNQIDASTSQLLEGSFNNRNAIFKGNKISAKGHSIHADRCGSGCESVNWNFQADRRPKQIRLDGLGTTVTDEWMSIIRQAGPEKVSADQLGFVDMNPSPAQAAGARPFMLDLESVPIGDKPLGMTYYVPRDNSHAIAVAPRSGNELNKCLMFLDGAKGAPRYEPFAVLRLEHLQRTTEVEFNLWVDERAEFIHEWRDTAVPYHAGPSVQITPRGVIVNGRVVGTVSPRTWMHVHVRAALGAQAGKWDLDISGAADVHLKQIEIPGVTGSWQRLEWMGFISNTETASQACLSELTVHPQ